MLITTQARCAPVPPPTLTGLKLRADQLVLDLDALGERIHRWRTLGVDQGECLDRVLEWLDGASVVADSLADRIDDLRTL